MKLGRILVVIISLLMFVACTKKKTNVSERFYFRTNGVDLAVQVDGNVASKTFILLLHGGPGGGASEYNSGYYSEKLEEEYAMIYVDQRGNGASQGNYNTSDLTLQQNSDDIYALVKFIKQKYGTDISLFLLGHSWGGITSAHALTHTNIQEELNGWIEVDGVFDFELNNKEEVKLFLEVGNNQVAKGEEVSFWNEVLTRVSQIDTNNISEDDISYLNSKGFEAENKITDIDKPEGEGARLTSYLSSPDFGLAIYMSNQGGNPILNGNSIENPITNKLQNINIPSQFLWGKYDLVVPPALATVAYNKVGTSNKYLFLFEHSGHSPMSNEPELFVSKVKDFVNSYK